MSWTPPDYQGGIRVLRQYSATGEAWRIDVKHNGAQCGVDIICESMGSPPESLDAALATLNARIARADMPIGPLTRDYIIKRANEEAARIMESCGLVPA